MIQGIKVPLKLTIIETTTWDADFIRNEVDQQDDYTKEPIPTFTVETGDGTVEWEPQFICPVCDTEALFLNKYISYDDENDLLFIPNLDEGTIVGYQKPPTREPILPKIQKCPSN